MAVSDSGESKSIFSKGQWRKTGTWSDTFYAPAEREKSWHPHQLPLAPVEDLVRCLTDAGDLVVDPCGGGFTTAIACYRLGRRFVGCDADADAVAIGRKRLAGEADGHKAAPGNGRK
jgi:site-specific DNA-methyltransferase (adenine-specific)